MDPRIAPFAPDGRRPFIGRGLELDRLCRALEESSGGRGQLVLLIGEPGIGKTRTSTEIAERARAAGAEILIGRCYEDEGAPPLWPWVQILRAFVESRRGDGLHDALGADAVELAQIVPEVRAGLSDLPALSPDADGAATRFRLFDAVTSCLGRAARSRPLVLVLDDLQGADQSSLWLLRFLARAMTPLPLLVVGTLRDAALTPGSTSADILADILREPVTSRIWLTGFTHDEVARFVAEASGTAPSSALVARIHERTDGNPFFVSELVRLLMETGQLATASSADAAASLVPSSVSATVGRRLALLSDGCVEMLRLASGYGREFRADAVARANGLDDDRLAPLLVEALKARLIGEVADQPGRYRFAHALTREALYRDVPAPLRPALHRQLAEALEVATSGQVDPPLSELAAHFLAANDPRGIGYARRAGDRAFQMLAYEDAVQQYDAALQALERRAARDEHLECELLLDLARIRNHAGETARAQELATRAAESARRRGASDQLAHAALAFSPRFLWESDTGAVDPAEVALLEEALAGCGGEDSTLHVELLARLATALNLDVNAAPKRRALSERAVAMARRIGDRATLAYALRAEHVAIWAAGTVEERLAIATELVQLGVAARDPELTFQGHFWRFCDYLALGEAGALDAEFEACTRLADPRDAFRSVHLACLHAVRALIDGRWNDAFGLVTNLGAHDESWTKRVMHELRICIFWCAGRQLGRTDTMVGGFRMGAAARESIPLMRCALACVLAESGADDARAEYDAFVPHGLARLPDDFNRLVSLVHLADACRELGDVGGAATLYDALLPHARLCADVANKTGFFGAAALYLGMLATMSRRWPEAERHLRDALAVHEKMRAAPWIARTRFEQAAMHLARRRPGDVERARRLVAAARPTAAGLDMSTLVAKLDALGAEADASPESRRLLPPEGGRVSHAGAHGVNAFRRDGEYWNIVYAGTSIRLRDTKGLSYIARLLASPARDVHVAELSGLGTSGNGAKVPPGMGEERDLGAVLDPRAVAEYRARLADVREELDEATATGDIGRAARARHEIDAITQALSAAFGLGSRSRKLGDPSERLRKAVRIQIRRTVERIGRRHAALGRHLANSLRTGVVCAYRPEQPVEWDVE
jgi:tetratricopeptide (TPR) repeat protein